MGMSCTIFKGGILTASDLGSHGKRSDESGSVARELLRGIGIDIICYRVVPDEREEIGSILRAWVDQGQLDIVVTTGGTGLAPRDVTPEATLECVDYQVLGMAEAMRAEGLRHTPLAMISRAVVGVRGRSLIANLPGSPRGVQQNLSVILPVIRHSLELLNGEDSQHTV